MRAACLAATGQSASGYDLNSRRHYLNNPKTYISAQQCSAETEKMSTASLTASKT